MDPPGPRRRARRAVRPRRLGRRRAGRRGRERLRPVPPPTAVVRTRVAARRRHVAVPADPPPEVRCGAAAVRRGGRRARLRARPEADGIRATEWILATLPEPPRIVVVTTFENDSYVYDALRAGAAGFLLKRADADTLVGAVRLVATGLTNAEIAGRLGVGPATAKTHVAAVLAKTGARDRTQAVIRAYEAGFVNGR
ncbi:LuxR C-terminal-related transcriptional regulator [Streptomyces sp. NBC_00334]|uniref:LuxR C-terminal-related transcriptional regulator n=1 Tax=Streptomyces sp. NBC_00334 TaxID=2975713 RepID=UPI003FA6C27E